MSARIFVFGDNIDTDRIIAGKYTKTLDPLELASHVFEDLDPDFRFEVKAGDIVVAGFNFGCGSSREQAPLAMKSAGVELVVAKSFARIFFRNAINIGLPLMEIYDHSIEARSNLVFDLHRGLLHDTAQQRQYKTEPLPIFLAEIMRSGGLVPYLRERGDYV